MSTENNMSKKFVVLAGILAFGLLTASFVGEQMLNIATAQSGSEEGKTVTSIDDIDCSKVKSTVHCVDDVPVTETNISGITAVPFYHGSFGTSTVSTSGTATTKVQPDKVSVTVGVETNGTTADEAASKNADLMAQVIAALKELGLSDDQIATSNYNVYPVYSVKEPVNVCRVMEGFPIPPECYVDQEITGYKAVNSVTVTLDADGDIDVGEVIDAAIEDGANIVNGVFYFLSQERQQQVQEDLIGQAIDNARHRAETAAQAVGMQVSGIKSISLNDVYFPIFREAAQSADTQILPGEQEVTMTVSLVYEMSDGSPEAGNGGEDKSAAENAVAIARQFVLSKLPSLGIQIDNELDLHSDMVVEITESEFHVEIGIIDINGQSHKGHIEITNGKVTVAILEGESIL